jgi:WD40 repeat protein
VTVVAFSPDGTRVLSDCGVGTMVLWDCNLGVLKKYTRDWGFLLCFQVAFSPSGDRVLSGSRDSRIEILNH